MNYFQGHFLKEYSDGETSQRHNTNEGNIRGPLKGGVILTAHLTAMRLWALPQHRTKTSAA